MKKYRFFFHYNKGKKAMSVHYKGTCYIVNNVVCDVPCETKWRPTQPHLVMQGFASMLWIRSLDKKAIIS
jgi:hypothetical protein